MAPRPTSDHQTWRGRIIRARSLVKRSLCFSTRLKAEGPCGLERGHVEVVLRLWCACVSGCGGEMLLVSAPHGGALGPCLACRSVCARKRTQQQLVSLRRRIWRHGTCALGHPRSSERPAAGGSGDPGTCAKPAKSGRRALGRRPARCHAQCSRPQRRTPSGASGAMARGGAGWRREGEIRRQHGRPEAKPQTPAASQRNPRPPLRGKTAGCAFSAGVVWFCKIWGFF